MVNYAEFPLNTNAHVRYLEALICEVVKLKRLEWPLSCVCIYIYIYNGWNNILIQDLSGPDISNEKYIDHLVL